jgi:HAD superfamily hydrolase (TIGR01509 family)
MSITTVVFDFGNVLGFFSRRKAAEQLAKFGPASPNDVEAFLFAGKLEEDFELGAVTTHAFRRLVRDEFGLDCDDRRFDAAYTDMFHPNPDVCPLPRLLAKRFQLVLLSNTNPLHARRFLSQFADTLAPFHHRLLSFEVGCRKPDPDIYRRCQGIVDRPATECLFIDDMPENVDAARALGWRGIVYRPGDDLRRALAELGVEAEASPIS